MGWLSRETGIAPSTLSGYRKGSIPSADVALRLADAMGVEVRWLVSGEGPQEPAEKFADQYTTVRRYEVRAGAGTGLVATAEDVTEELSFRRDWLRRIGMTPQNAGLITAQGDSMHPTIPDGAMLLIDLSIRDVRNGYIYVVVKDGSLLVKRVQTKMDGSVVLISDNPVYEREELPANQVAELHIAGRVVWVGHPI